MTKPFPLFLLLAGCVALASCNARSDKSAAAGGGKSATYLATLGDDYRKVLTKEDVLKHVQLADPTQLKMATDVEEATGQGEYGSCSYEWPSDRPPMKISTHFPEQPDMNSVRISNLSFDDGELSQIRSRFETAYKPMTAEQIDAAAVRMKKQFEGKPADQLETAMGFLKSRAKSTFRHVENVGDSAYWQPAKVMDMPLGAQLVVLTGNAKFTITAKTSTDDAENLELAKKVAREILAKAG